MAISSSDIGFFNSGSSSFNLGLGGGISSIVLGNTLFNDLTSQESLNGLVDYKCIYLKNLNSTDNFYNLSITLTDSNYSDISFGFPYTRRCNISGCNNIFAFDFEEHVLTFEYSQGANGEFNLNYGPTDILIIWDGNSQFLKSQLETGLSFLGDELLINVEEQICQNSLCSMVLSIKFSRPKQYKLMTISGLNLSSGSLSFSSFRRNKGGPIDSLASSIDNTKVVPKNTDGTDIVFFSNNEKIIFEKFGPGEVIPIWLKRSTPAGGISNTSSDEFSFVISAANNSVAPTPTPSSTLVTFLDQSQTIRTDDIVVDTSKVYWQTFKAGYTGNLTNIELGFYNQSDDAFVVGSSHLRLYSGEGIVVSNIVHSSSISVNISPGLIYNSYLVNIPVTAGEQYTIGYFPGFVHKLPINSNQVYLDGKFGINSDIQPNKDLLFKTYIRTIPNPTPTPTPTKSSII